MKGIVSWTVVCIIILVTTVQVQAEQWFSEKTINTIVLLEKKHKGEFKPHGTGFLMWNYKDQIRPIVISCQHTLERPDIYVVVVANDELASSIRAKGDSIITMGKSSWTLEGNNLRLHVKLQKDITYVTHPDADLDLAAFPIDLITRKVKGDIKREWTKTKMVPKTNIMLKNDAYLGQEVYFVGFPLGIGTKGTICPLVRSGSIAWLSESFKEFLIDAFAYPGNSGSPIYTKMNSENPYPNLVGMITGHLETRCHNSGLARCIWTDDILEVAQLAEKL